MKLRLALLLLLVFLSLAISADRTSNTCPGAWSAITESQTADHALGVNIHFTDARPGEIKMIADAGFRWVRMDFKWDVTETERGRYDFSAYDRLMAALNSHHIQALFILDYGNPLYTIDKAVRTEEARQAFARWVVAAARHFAGRGIIWEVFNEPNVRIFWPPQPNVNEYIALALTVGRAFHAAVPTEKLIGPATSGIDFPFLEACFKAGLLDYWSAVSVHPYRQSNPEAAANEYCQLREMIASYAGRRSVPPASAGGYAEVSEACASGGVIPIISGEWGYSSVWRGLSEEKQAELLAREMLTNLANGIPISIWYDWRDDGLDPKEPEHHFGLVRNAVSVPPAAGNSGGGFPVEWPLARADHVYEPKPAYLAAKTLNAQLDGYRFEKRLAVGSDGDYVLLFVRNKTYRIAAWTTSSGPRRVVIPVETGQFQVSKHTGERLGPAQSGPQGLALTLSNAPIYVTHRAR